MLKSVSGLCGRSVKVIVSWPVSGSGVTVPGQLDVGGEAVGDEEDPVAVAGQRLAEVDEAGERAGQRRAVDLEAADLRELGALGRVARCRSWPAASEQEVLPSAALGLIEKPGGRVTVAPRSSDGEGMVGLSCWGTLRSTSMPEAVVGLGRGRLRVEARVEAELVAAGRLRPGGFGLVAAAVVGEDVERGAQRTVAGGRVLQEGRERAVRRPRRKF